MHLQGYSLYGAFKSFLFIYLSYLNLRPRGKYLVFKSVLYSEEYDS